jgi:hypothetical protein
MATYVPGVGSYLPDFKPFTPDYKFLSNVLDTKTQKYETNFKQLNDLYSKVVYGNLSRKDTQEMRDQYAENLAPKLQQIAGMDLSMAQNVDAAKALFRPFFEEDLIVKDLAQTKKYRNEMQYADMLKNSPVQEEREKYWQTGVQKMQYEMEDFVNADQDKALKMSMPTYVPDSDLYQMAMKYLEESELGTDVVTTISENGEWLIHRKNGDLITNEALTMVQKALKDDPMVVNAYHADAFVKSRQYADKGIEEGRFQTVDQGQYDWAANKITEIETEIDKRKAALEEQKKQAEQKNTAWQNAQKQNGVIKGSPEEKKANESKSQLNSIQERLKELNLLSDDQPQSETNLKTTGEYNPQDTQSLLYRAYSLMMNYNMEADLQAAALTYSKKDMMMKLEANDYAVLAKKHKYDMDKLATEHRYRKEEIRLKALADIEVEKEKNKMLGIDKLEGLGANRTTTDPNTITGGYVDEDGNVELEGDYLDSQEGKVVKLSNKIDAGEVQWTLDLLRRKQGLSNNGSGLITMDGVGTMSAADLQKELIDAESGGIKSKYKEAFNKAYSDMQNLVTNIDPTVEAFGDGSPLLFDSKNKAEEFARISAGMDNLREQRMAIDHNLEKLYEVSDRNIKKAVNSDFDLENGEEFAGVLQKAVNAGMPTLFYKDEDGVTRKHTESSYRTAYSNWIKSGGGKGISVEDIDADGFDDSSWMKHHSYEHSQLGDGTMADLGQGKPTEVYEFSGGSYGGSPLTMGTSNPTYSGGFGTRLTGEDRFVYDKGRSDKQADAFYKSMYELNNYAIRGKLEATQDVTDSKGDLAEKGKIFEVWDINQGMRGIGGSDQDAGEIFNNPSYEVMLDPLAVSDDAAEFIKIIDSQISNNEIANNGLFLYNVGFNEIQKSDRIQDDDDKILTPGDEQLEQENFDLAKTVYNQYIMDLTKRRTTESKAQGDYPIAKIKYFTSWTSDGDRLDSPYSGYTITLSDEYMSSLRKTGGILEGQKEMGNVISVVIPKNQDKNPRKFGEFNFSYVSSEISSSEDASFKKSIPGGGSFSITQGTGGDYNINYQILQFDNSSGEYKSASFTKQMLDSNGNLITQSNRNELDFYMRQYLYELERVGSDNIRLRDAWKKANPQALVQNPEYTFANR